MSADNDMIYHTVNELKLRAITTSPEGLVAASGIFPSLNGFDMDMLKEFQSIADLLKSRRVEDCWAEIGTVLAKAQKALLDAAQEADVDSGTVYFGPAQFRTMVDKTDIGHSGGYTDNQTDRAIGVLSYTSGTFVGITMRDPVANGYGEPVCIMDFGPHGSRSRAQQAISFMGELDSTCLIITDDKGRYADIATKELNELTWGDISVSDDDSREGWKWDQPYIIGRSRYKYGPKTTLEEVNREPDLSRDDGR